MSSVKENRSQRNRSATDKRPTRVQLSLYVAAAQAENRGTRSRDAAVGKALRDPTHPACRLLEEYRTARDTRREASTHITDAANCGARPRR